MAKTAASMLQDASSAHVRAPAAAQSPALASWPAVVMVAAVLGAALYAFSPRPLLSFPVTAIGPDQLLIDGLARSGSRLAAVGEQGEILIADNAKGPWRMAKVEPQRGSTLTQVLFVDDQLALAVGHDSWILRSTDAGASWHEVNFNPELSEPLLGIAGPYDGKLFAFGGFGQMLVSTDRGQTWQPQKIDTAAPSEAPKPAAANADPFASDPFGAGATADSGGDRHFNGMVQLSDGALLLVGEKGLMMKSVDHGEHWTMMPPIYNGSFFGAMQLPSNAVMVYGMRGHAFVSHDAGKSWQASSLPIQGSLFGGTVTTDGTIYLVGDSNTVLVSKDAGASFSLAARADHVAVGARGGLAAVLPLTGNALLTAGESGVGVQNLAAGETAPPAGATP